MNEIQPTPSEKLASYPTNRFVGIGASPGFCLGKAFLIDRRRFQIPKYHISTEEQEVEIHRLEQAIALADFQFEELLQKASLSPEAFSQSSILEAYRLILHDDHLLLPTIDRIKSENLNAEWALQKTLEELKRRFDGISIEHFRERRSDVGFVGEQILQNLLGDEPTTPPQPPEKAIIVAYELSPADLLHLHPHHVSAIVTATGGRTSHLVILARAFSLPVVIGLGDDIEQIGNGDFLIVDGTCGEVWYSPTEEQIETYQQKIKSQSAIVISTETTRHSQTLGQHQEHIQLLANIELQEEIPVAIQHGAEGIGLYRTEFLFLDRTEYPTEQEHFIYAKEVLQQIGSRPATFRTFDLGTDKLPPFLSKNTEFSFFSEPNPALGLRSLRLCLKEQTLFKTQLRGLLRASMYGDLRLMFPMVSGLSELREAKELLYQCQEELRREGIPFQEKIPVGIMIEMPAAVMIADHLAKEADFFSIGTNDLLQYTLAFDRTNDSVDFLYQPLHPALLRMIKQTVIAAQQEGIPVSLCGEMAGNHQYTRLLLGLGLRQLSMYSNLLPQVLYIVQHSTIAETEKLAQNALSLATTKEIEQLLQEDLNLLHQQIAA